MFKNFPEYKQRLQTLEIALSDQKTIENQSKYQELLKEHSKVSQVVKNYEDYLRIGQDIEEAKKLLLHSKPEESDYKYLEQEIHHLEQSYKAQEAKVKAALIPKDKNDEKDVIIEIRAGTGGDEAAIFAADLFRMYTRYAENRAWKVEIFNSSRTAANKGFKEIIFSLQGESVYSFMRFESGVHRVQRVPDTEANGRIHTSAATVWVMPEANEVDVEISPNDLRIDVFRSSGHGGQHVNTTDSAVRIIHIPTNVMVTCQDEKSQLKNKAKAMRVLRARVKEKFESDHNAEQSKQRLSHIGTGDRSEKIRTYNFPQNRITDHRIGLTLYNLEEVMDGVLDEIINELLTHFFSQYLT